MRNFVILLKKNLIEMIRNKRVLIFSIVFVSFSIISAVSARYLPELIKWILSEAEGAEGFDSLVGASTVADSYIQFISNIGQIAILFVPLMFASTIVREKEKGTYNVLKMNKVKDSEIVLAHLVSQIVLVTVCYLVSVAVFVPLNILLFKQIMGLRGFVTLVYLYLLLIIDICITMFISCLCKKKGKSYLFVVLVYFGLSIIDAIPKINRFLPYNLLSLSNELMLYPSYKLSDHLITVISTLVISVVFVVLSIFVTRNRIDNSKVNDNDNRERV